MAITGTKAFTAGEVLTAANTNQYLMRGVKVFADAATRAAAYGGVGKPTLEEGEASYLLDSNNAYVYDGAAWQLVGGSITGTVASAATIAVLPNAQYLLTGTTTTSAATGGSAGAELTLVASGQSAGVCVIIAHGTGANQFTLRDSSNLGIYAGESLSFIHNGTAWVEVNRNLKSVLSYTQITANVTTTATTEATAVAAVTANAITFDGATPIRLEAYTPGYSNTVAAVELRWAWYDGSSSIAISDKILSGYGSYANNGEAQNPVYRLTPAAGSKTYSIRIYTPGGNTAQWKAGAGGAGALPPAYLRVSRDL